MFERLWRQIPPFSPIGIAIAILLGIFGIVFPPVFPPAPIPAPEPAPKPVPSPDPWNAIGRVQFGNAGCTATVLGPQRPDGRWDVLTANHCVEGQPNTGQMRMRDGQEFTIRVVSRVNGPDLAICVTEQRDLHLPFALLADKLPTAGDPVFHGGFGQDKPGNREEGVVVTPDNGDGHTHFRLNVSSGDSGGGICLTKEGRVLSAVCCTSARGRMADVFGGNIVEIKKLRGSVLDAWSLWTPSDVPLRAGPKKE